MQQHLKNLKVLDCHNNQLEELELPRNMRWVDCHSNKLHTLVLNFGVETVICYDNPNLTIHYLPKSLKYLKCDAGAVDPNDYKDRDDLTIEFV